MSTEVEVTKNLNHVDIQKLKQYATVNQKTIDTAVADKVVEIDLILCNFAARKTPHPKVTIKNCII